MKKRVHRKVAESEVKLHGMYSHDLPVEGSTHSGGRKRIPSHVYLYVNIATAQIEALVVHTIAFTIRFTSCLRCSYIFATGCVVYRGKWRVEWQVKWENLFPRLYSWVSAVRGSPEVNIAFFLCPKGHTQCRWRPRGADGDRGEARVRGMREDTTDYD